MEITAQRSILVTGGAGYIGSHVAYALVDRGEKVVVIDDLSEGVQKNVPAQAHFIRGSVGDAQLVETVIREHQISAILHFAGFIRVEESVREPEKYFKNNTENTGVLVDRAINCGVRDIIFSSSAAVYGNPEHVPITEDDSTRPINPYGESKLRAEKIITDSKSRSVILRYFNVAGVDGHGRIGYRIEKTPTHMIRSCVRACVEKKQFTIYGNDFPTPDGTCVRDYIHVSDLAEVHVKALDYLRNDGTPCTLNCGDGHGYSNRQVVQMVENVSGEPFSFQYGPRREGDPAMLIADSSRAQKILAWKPHLSLEDMIRHELAWVRSQTQP